VIVGAGKKGDPLKILGNLLLFAGIGVWAVYALLHFGMGWAVTMKQFLPFHLAGVLPGVILRRRWFLGGD
jgi:hypothetical protein